MSQGIDYNWHPKLFRNIGDEDNYEQQDIIRPIIIKNLYLK